MNFAIVCLYGVCLGVTRKERERKKKKQQVEVAQEAFVGSSEDVVDQFNVIMQEGQESHLLASLSDRLPPPGF